jgi:hypothetical protein
MKKIIIAMLLVCAVLLMADPIPIGDGAETNHHLPMEPFYGYTYSQVIYTADEIGEAVNIENVAWHYNGNSAWVEDVVVYMGHTTLDEFGTYPSWIPLEELTQVWSGGFTALDFDHWVTIDLDEIFAYNGTDNLVIAFDANTEGYSSSLDEFYGTTTDLNRSIYFYSDSNNPDPANPPTTTYRQNYDPDEAAKIGKTRERAAGVQAYIANIILNHDGVLPSGFVNGYVYDTDTNAPIEGATVAAGNFQAVSDAAGFYEIEVLVEGEYSVTATHPDYLPADAGMVYVVFDETQTLDIYMEINDLQGDQPGMAIVIDAFPYFDTGDTSLGFTSFIGNPAPDIFYTFTTTETLLLDMHTCGSDFDTYLRLYDDAMSQVAYNDDGCYGWPTGSSAASWIGNGEGTIVPAGTYYICVEGYSSASGYYELTVEELLPPEFGSLEGTVTDASNALPLEGVLVNIAGVNATTDASGYYLINDIETGLYSVTFSKDTYFSQTINEVEILAEQSVTLDAALEPILYGNVEGIVYQSGSEIPIEGADVSIGGTTVTTDASGYYLVTGLEIGYYDINVNAAGYFPAIVTGVEVLADQTITEDVFLEIFDDVGDTLENPIIVDGFPYFMSGDIAPYTDNTTLIELEYGRSGKDIFYQVDLPNGATAEFHGCGSEFDTYMNLYDDTLTRVAYDDDGCSSWPSGSSMAPWIGQDQGTYNVVLTPGTYYVVMEAYSSSYTEGYFEVHLDVLDPPETGSLEGVVTDQFNGNPIAGATVTCGDEEAVTDPDGYYNIPFILTGTYEAACSAAGYESAAFTDVIINAEETTTLNFALNINMMPPTELSAAVDGYNVNLQWNAPDQLPERDLREAVDSREFTGTYKVYRNNELAATVEDTQFTDLELNAGNYDYYVTAIYDEGESAASNSVSVAVGNAEITYTPEAFDVVLGADQTMDQSLTIGNAGDLGLEYQAEIIYYAGRATAEVYPMNEEYWTGTTDYLNFIENSMVDATPGNEAWMMFDVSQVPDFAVINSIECYVYVNDTNYPFWSLTPCTLDPLATDAATLAEHINAGQGSAEAYSYNNESSSFEPGWHNYSLTGTAADDLSGALMDDWFAVGASPRDSGTSYYTIIDGWNEENPPYLVIDYSIPIDPWVTFDGNMGVNGNIEAGAADQTHNLHFDSAGLVDGDVMMGEIVLTSNDQTNSEIIIPLTLTVGESFLYGDVTGDELVDAFDAANVLQYTVGLDPVAAPLPWTWQITAGDVDGNGAPEAYDAALILQHAVGIIDTFPVEARFDTPRAVIDVTASAGEFIFSTSGNLYGFSVITDTELISFGNIEIDYLHAVNGNAVALASAEPINGEFLRIPFNKLAASGEFLLTLKANGISSDHSYYVESLESAPVVNAVLGNYPNPFNPATSIKLQVKEISPVSIDIYNVKGQLVKNLINETVPAGVHSFEWSGSDNSSRPAASGVYFYKVKIGELNETRKMIMLK